MEQNLDINSSGGGQEISYYSNYVPYQHLCHRNEEKFYSKNLRATGEGFSL